MAAWKGIQINLYLSSCIKLIPNWSNTSISNKIHWTGQKRNRWVSFNLLAPEKTFKIENCRGTNINKFEHKNWDAITWERTLSFKWSGSQRFLDATHPIQDWYPKCIKNSRNHITSNALHIKNNVQIQYYLYQNFIPILYKYWKKYSTSYEKNTG